jgi:hypothetical protein
LGYIDRLVKMLAQHSKAFERAIMSLLHDARISIVIERSKPRAAVRTLGRSKQQQEQYETVPEPESKQTAHAQARAPNRMEQAWFAQIDNSIREYIIDRGRYPCEDITASYCQGVVRYLFSQGYDWQDVMRRIAVFNDMWVDFMAVPLRHTTSTTLTNGKHIQELTAQSLDFWLQSIPGTAHLGLPIKWWISGIAPKADCQHACFRTCCIL